jgi:hypothetical protein
MREERREEREEREGRVFISKKIKMSFKKKLFS